MCGSTVGKVVARLVAQASVPPSTDGADSDSPSHTLEIYADYGGVRTHAKFDPTTTSVEITTGPPTGRRYKTPSAAARAVVAQLKPTVDANRNGWTFWRLASTGAPLKTVKDSKATA